MCGVVGNTYGDVEEVERALDKISHRGPDGRGVTVDGDVVLGHVRLSVRDLSGSAQPYQSGDTTISYNGELWDIEDEDSDTAFFASALDQEGVGALTHPGQYAVAWTGPAGTFLARDRYGETTLLRRASSSGVAMGVRAAGSRTRSAAAPGWEFHGLRRRLGQVLGA